MPKSSCLTCGKLTPIGQGYCQPHRPMKGGRRYGHQGDWAKVRALVVARDKQCVQCGSKAHLSVDHIVPLARGGTNSPLNLQVLCRFCNSSKGAR